MTTYDPKRHHRRSIRLKGYDYGQPGAYFVTICTQGGECLFGQVRDGRMHPSPAGEMVWRWWRALEDKYPAVRSDAAVVMPNHFHGIIVIAGDATGQARRPAPTDTDRNTTVGATLRGRPIDGEPDTGAGGDATVSGQVPGQARRPAPTDAGGHTTVGATLRGRPTGGHPQGSDPDSNAGTDMDSGQARRPAPTATDGDTAVGATLRGRPTGGRTSDGHADGDADERKPTLGQIVGWFKTMTTNEYIRGVKQRGWPPFPGRVWQRNYYEHIIRNQEALERIRVYIQTNPERWALDRENPQREGLDELESWIYGPGDDAEA